MKITKNKTIIVIFVLFLCLSSVLLYKYRSKIHYAKTYLLEKEQYRYKATTNPLRDKMPNNPNEIIFGLDLSHHQRHINWKKVAQNPPHFILFKATEGSSHKDSKYKHHIKEARNHNIIVGGYHFFSYQSSGKGQAKHFLKQLQIQKGDILPVLDVEFTRTMQSDEWITQNIADFIDVVENEIGKKPIIYCEIAYYNRYLKPKYGDELQLWLSDFKRKPKNHFIIWQTTDKYKQVGIPGTVDYNIFNGTKSELMNFTY